MLIGIETSNPPYKVSQAKATEELKNRMAVKPAVARLIDSASVHSGIDFRYISIPDAEENTAKKFFSENGTYISPVTSVRMTEYEKWSALLAKQAAENVLSKHNMPAKSIQKLITISCTGFFAPGIDYQLINELGIPPNVKRTNIGFMGCAASIIGFNSVLEAMNSAEGELNTLLISVELCSLHLQTEPTRDNILANIIFADGCAAALFSNSNAYKASSYLKLISTDSLLFDNSSGMMGWKIGNEGFAMSLSSELPKAILNQAVPSLLDILIKHGIKKEDIKHWALHPGGRAILDALCEGIGLNEAKMFPSRKVLKNFGNMSSASILFVLKEIISNNEIQRDDLCCAVAFGPGLTMEVALFRGV